EFSDQVVAKFGVLPGDFAVVPVTSKAFTAFLKGRIQFGILNNCPTEGLGKVYIQILCWEAFGLGSPVVLTCCRLKNVEEAYAQPSASFILRQGQVVQHPIEDSPFVGMPPSTTRMVEGGAGRQADEIHLVLS